MRRKRMRADGTAKPRMPEPALESFGGDQKIKRIMDIIEVHSEIEREESIRSARTEKAIKEIFDRLSPQQRTLLFRIYYDRFAENYDRHMEETGHFAAIERVMSHAAPFIRFPMIDLTAGTGEPMVFAICKSPDHEGRFSGRGYAAYLNEISPLMLERAREKLEGAGRFRFRGYDALRLPSHLRGRFKSALCSQTLHLMSDKDKPKLVRSMHNALGSGGVAIVIEEDPFMVTQTPAIGAVSRFIESIASPLSSPDKIRGLFTPFGFEKIKAGAYWPIDSHHAMHLHLFRKV